MTARFSVFLLLAIGRILLTPGAMAAPVTPYFNGVFPLLSPDQTGWTTENAFPQLTFVDPMWITEVPGTTDRVVVGKQGKIVRFPGLSTVTPAEVTVVLDLASSVQVSEDQGLYQMIFHPEFGEEGSAHANDVFVTYSHRPNHEQAGPNVSLWRLSRFTWDTATGTIDPATESVLIQQFDPDRWHNGGAMNFDNDGFLLVTCGDGGGGNDSLGLSQRLDHGFFGGVLRIDVDNDPARSHAIRRQPASPSGKPATFPVSLSQGYGIPNDNPWLDAAGGRLEEFYAIGLRSPHTAHHDPVTGDLWVGDVGQFLREELNQVKRGNNHQWPFMQATVAGPKTRDHFQGLVGTETPPYHSYDRTVGSCIIGGMRYRGAKWASELGGKILYGDNGEGTLLTLTPGAEGALPEITELLANFAPPLYNGLANICTDSAGEIYLMKLNGQSQDGGTIRKLVATSARPQPPQLLSATGLFTDTANLVPSPALIPYEVASPLWSDGAAKKRWIALPNNGVHDISSETILYSATENWSFPSGTVFVKHFEMPVDARDPAVVKRLETRVMVCTDSGGKYGVTYRWNAQGTDAVLLAAGEDEIFQITNNDGSTAQRTWSYPSRSDCLQCHTPASGQAIGIRTHQLNLKVPHPGTGIPVNQLTHFFNQGYFRSLSSLPVDSLLEARAIDDVAAPAEHRVRSYLDSNCAHCHQPGGTVPYFDARLQTPLKNQNLVDALIKGQFNLPGGCYIKPGDPALSAVHVRTASTQPGIAMPPLGKHVVDAQAVALMNQYITGLTAAEFAVTPAPQARYVRFNASPASGNMLAIGELVVLDGNGVAIPRAGITVSAFTSEGTAGSSANVIDGDPWSYWSTTAASPTGKSITLDLGSAKAVGGIEYTPRQDSATGRPRNYQVHYSMDGTAWTTMTSKSVASPPPATTERFDGFVNRRRVRATIAAAPTSLSKTFPVTIVFDSAVTDFSATDLSVTGGTVQSIRGSGYYWVATLSANQANVTVSIPANQVNPGSYGNLVSNTVSVTSSLQTPPVPTFTAQHAFFDRLLELRLSFDQGYTGLSADDFLLENATLEWFIEEGNTRRLLLAPKASGSIGIRLPAGSVMGTNGVPIGDSQQFTVQQHVAKLDIEAEDMYSYFYMREVSDTAASNGAYVWSQEDTRGGDTSYNTLHVISEGIHLPHAGNYRVRAWTRADNLTSDSFHILLGTSDPTIHLWRTNQAAGEVGSGQFHPGFVSEDGGQPIVFQLPAGSSTLDISAAEDGTRIDRVALIPERPYPVWSGPAASSSRPLSATLRFPSPVTGLSLEDFEVLGGTITSLTGSGQDYVVTLQPDSDKVALKVMENAVTDEFSALGVDSLWFFARWNNTYAQWALDRGLSSAAASDGLDGDADGVAQIMEYALGMDPKKADSRVVDPADPASRGLPAMSIDGTGGNRRLSMTFHRRRGGLPLDYAAEFTGDFLDYARYSDFTGKTQVLDDEWERVTATDEDATGSEPKRFGRLKVER